MKKSIVAIMFLAACVSFAAAAPQGDGGPGSFAAYGGEDPVPSSGQEGEPSEKDINISTDSAIGCDDEALVRQYMKEAAQRCRAAIARYEKGDFSGAREDYYRMLALFVMAGGDCDVWYGLKDELALMFTRLGCVEEKDAGRSSAIAPFPLDSRGPEVQKCLAAYRSAENAAEIRSALERSGRYRPLIFSILKEYGLPEELIYLPVVESMYSNNCRSKAGAEGIWQLMPERARALGLKVNFWVDERRDIEKATRAAARYLRDLYLLFDDWPLALAAYNRGEFGLARDLERSNAACIELASGRGILPRETELFVPRFIACTLIGKDPEQYGGFSVSYEEPLRYDTVVISKAVDLKIAAQCAGCTVSELRALNPSLKAWCTPYRYSRFTLNLPAGTGKRFMSAIAAVQNPDPDRGYIKYRAVCGERLDAVARRFATTLQELCLVNRLGKDTPVAPCDMVLMVKPGIDYLNGTGEKENERG